MNKLCVQICVSLFCGFTCMQSTRCRLSLTTQQFVLVCAWACAHASSSSPRVTECRQCERSEVGGSARLRGGHRQQGHRSAERMRPSAAAMPDGLLGFTAASAGQQRRLSCSGVSSRWRRTGLGFTRRTLGRQRPP